jgi:hypothetical protein
MRAAISLVMCLTSLAVTSAQQKPTTSPVPTTLAAARTVRCTFPKYAGTRWIDGTPETVMGTDELTFDIDAINVKARTARIVAGTAAVLVSASMSQTGLNVIEQTPIGNFILTTVFTGGREGGTFRAVHSRHLGDPTDFPSPSQYFGSCEILR